MKNKKTPSVDTEDVFYSKKIKGRGDQTTSSPMFFIKVMPYSMETA